MLPFSGLIFISLRIYRQKVNLKLNIGYFLMSIGKKPVSGSRLAVSSPDDGAKNPPGWGRPHCPAGPEQPRSRDDFPVPGRPVAAVKRNGAPVRPMAHELSGLNTRRRSRSGPDPLGWRFFAYPFMARPQENREILIKPNHLEINRILVYP
jgi:hypothetical protein